MNLFVCTINTLTFISQRLTLNDIVSWRNDYIYIYIYLYRGNTEDSANKRTCLC